MIYGIFEGNRRLSMVIAPSAPGITCTQANAQTQVGCRSLAFTYQLATFYKAPAYYGSRLQKITYYGPSGPGTMSHWDVSRIQLQPRRPPDRRWDPRLVSPLKETYAYAETGAFASARLGTITPPGEEPWTLEYSATSPANTKRLIAVKRASPTIAQTSIVYEVPLSGAGAPYDLSAGAIAKWGSQTCR